MTTIFDAPENVRAVRHGRPERPLQVLGLSGTGDRFWSKVSGGDFTECWKWTAARSSHGYGRFHVGGRSGRMEEAHRVAYLLMVGEIPDGLELDHLCRNPSCVNPWHLEPVTHRVNSQRSTAGQVNAARQRAITHCPKGHPYDGENTAYRPDGRRRCKACGREDTRRRYAATPEKHREAARRRRAAERSGR